MERLQFRGMAVIVFEAFLHSTGWKATIQTRGRYYTLLLLENGKIIKYYCEWLT